MYKLYKRSRDHSGTWTKESLASQPLSEFKVYEKNKSFFIELNQPGELIMAGKTYIAMIEVGLRQAFATLGAEYVFLEPGDVHVWAQDMH